MEHDTTLLVKIHPNILGVNASSIYFLLWQKCFGHPHNNHITTKITIYIWTPARNSNGEKKSVFMMSILIAFPRQRK